MRDVEINRVVAITVDLYVFDMLPERLECAGRRERDFGLLSPEEYFDLVSTSV